MSTYILDLIAQGEHDQLDFKFEVSDSRKIARTISAFANTRGGKLLIGVKDNGVIAGVRTDEEYYMLETAAYLYCKPTIPLKLTKWVVSGKTILEVLIDKIDTPPVLAKAKEDKFLAYVRVKDENFLANRVILKYWKLKNRTIGVHLAFSKREQCLMDYLRENEEISLSKYKKLAKISVFTAENILARFLSLKLIEPRFTGEKVLFSLANNEKE